MNVLVKDLRKYVPSLEHGYIHRYVKPTGDWKLINGALYKVFSLQTIKGIMKERRFKIMNLPKLSHKTRTTALKNINLVEYAIKEFEDDNK